MVCHVARGFYVAQSAFGPINGGFPTVRTTHGCDYKSLPTSLLTERGNGREIKRERLEENRVVPIVCPFGCRSWWPELVSPLPTAGARRGLMSGEGDSGVATV